MKKTLLFLIFLLITPTIFASQIQVALTIDDLPYVGPHKTEKQLVREDKMFIMFLEKLEAAQIPATGFVVVDSVGRGQWSLIERFKHAGFAVANHNYTHKGASRVPTDKYIHYIAESDKALQPYISTPKYFRFPYLDGGRGEKRKAIRTYLKEQGYIIAPVTMDTHDFKWNARYSSAWAHRNKAQAHAAIAGYLNSVNRTITVAKRRAMKKTGGNIKYILLIHMNTINARCLSRLINRFKRAGVQFITLKDAMSDPYYSKNV